MRGLVPRELDCLRRIAQDGRDLTDPCPPDVVDQLVNLGLVEKRSALQLPLEWVRTTYHLTRAGEVALGRS